ncbi:hypothetical protein LIER_23473 [Lithospermum erythrorhizon]|uniref:Uncharacterized protein n=1 Tax=Lithospermum erythrorhizon TaxID=34254 RepID=A0AAV3QYY7_LITER
MGNAGFELARRANSLDFENQRLMAQITQLCGIRDAALAETACAREEVKELQEEVQALKDVAARHPKKVWAAVENYKQSAELRDTILAAVEEFKESKEFEAALSAAVECFTTSPEFLDTLGINVAFGAFSFVKKYKEKYPDLRSDFAQL